MNKVMVAQLTLALFLLATMPVHADEKRPLKVVPSIDLSLYAGTWYEIARLPNSFQKKCVGEVTADYALREDGRMTVLNRCREASGKVSEARGVARVADKKKPNSILKVRFAPSFLSFLPFVWGDYYVIALSKDYRYALVGSPDRKYLWVLSRTPQLNEATYRNLLSIAQQQGFDVSRLIMTRQSGG